MRSKKNQKSAEEKAVFSVVCGQEWKDSVGYKLIKVMKTDIVFEQKRRNESDDRRSNHYETLYWNNGEPAYEIVKHAVITKNWRTGEHI